MYPNITGLYVSNSSSDRFLKSQEWLHRAEGLHRQTPCSKQLPATDHRNLNRNTERLSRQNYLQDVHITWQKGTATTENSYSPAFTCCTPAQETEMCLKIFYWIFLKWLSPRLKNFKPISKVEQITWLRISMLSRSPDTFWERLIQQMPALSQPYVWR